MRIVIVAVLFLVVGSLVAGAILSTCDRPAAPGPPAPPPAPASRPTALTIPTTIPGYPPGRAPRPHPHVLVVVRVEPDGTIVYDDGRKRRPDGTLLLPDGRVIPPPTRPAETRPATAPTDDR